MMELGDKNVRAAMVKYTLKFTVFKKVNICVP